MNDRACPFCGLASSVPHETQQRCIDALHAEIARVREILDVAKPLDAPIPPNEPHRQNEPQDDRSVGVDS